MQTKTIEYRGRVELYEIVDGYLEMFVGYVHRAESPREQYNQWARHLLHNYPKLLG